MKQFRLHAIVIGLAALLMAALPAVSRAVPQKGQPAPPMKVVTTSGQQVTLANYKGYVLVLDFFATWCPPCKASIPHLIGLNRKYNKQGLQIMGASLDDGDEGDVKEFIVDKRITYPVALAPADMQADYGIRSIPTIYVISKKGIIAERYMGFSDEMARNMEELIKKLLAE